MENKIRIILTVVAPVIVIALVLFNSSSEDMIIFMNGELSDRHSFLENDCKTCHVPWKGITIESCTDCHVDDEHYVDEEAAESIKRVDNKRIRCSDCHQEHQGRSHDLNISKYVST
jgi:hypothetical protein